MITSSVIKEIAAKHPCGHPIHGCGAGVFCCFSKKPLQNALLRMPKPLTASRLLNRLKRSTANASVLQSFPKDTFDPSVNCLINFRQSALWQNLAYRAALQHDNDA